MVDEAGDVSAPIAVDDGPPVETEAVVVLHARVQVRHATSELLLAHHFSDIFHYELTCMTSIAVNQSTNSWTIQGE